MRAVATVDQEEARNGASQSDGVRLASREQDKERNTVPLSVYLQRAAQFRGDLKKTKSEEPKEPECPIDKARAESTTGENTPLNWLVADHYGGQTDMSPQGDDLLSHSGDTLFQPSVSDFSFSLQAGSNDSPQSFLAGEWLLSPNS
jgi:hypothetical protein